MDETPGFPTREADIEFLRARNSALQAELETLKSVRDVERQCLLKLTAQLDALVRSSSEVRYKVNADWSELDQLQGGGFIRDNTQSNKEWIEAYIPDEHQQLVRDEISRAIAAKDIYNIEHMVKKVDGSHGWALSRAVPLFDHNGEIDSWMGSASDITVRKSSEETLRLLNFELAHRMKNTFAVVQAIVAQTLRLSDSVETAKEIINSRLQALASAQDILTSTEFTEADVGEIVKAALGAHQSPDARVEIVGERYSLNPQQALGLSLSIHELATNAVKYGALSNQSGKVVISWYLTGGQFEFQWVESGGPTVTIPTRQSFGSLLIKRVAASYFGGESLLDFKPEGLVYKLSVSKPAA